MNTHDLKKEFPIFTTRINGKPLVYLDSAATSQKPQCVLDAMNEYYASMNANIHRGVHTLSEKATKAYEDVRQQTAVFFGASNAHEIIFTRGATESINLIARGWGDRHIKRGDEIVVSVLEHHANLVPWQELAVRKNAHLKVIPLSEDYALDYDALTALLTKKTKLLCVTGLSNVTGTVVDLRRIILAARARGVYVVVDAAQRAAHMPLNVGELDCDWMVCSSHKMYGPTGVGVLYGKKSLLEAMDPLIVGGDMVTTVSQYSAQYREAPWKFEGGTPNIAGVVGFGAALSYLSAIGMNTIHEHTKEILAYATEVFGRHATVKLLTPRHGIADAILSFTIEGVHPHDVASVFDSEGVAIRSGLHCAQPLHNALGVTATARMSFGVYTSKRDIDIANAALQKVLTLFSVNN